MTEGAWPAGYARRGEKRVYQGRRRIHNDHAVHLIATLVAYLTGRWPATRSHLADAWTRTHTRVRVTDQHHARQVHEVWMRYPHHIVTACNMTVYNPRNAVWTGVPSTCDRHGCAMARVRSGRKAERPAPVDRPDGAYQGDAATTNSGVTLPDNSVTIPIDQDSFRSVKSADDSRVNGSGIAGRHQPRQRCEASETSPPIRRDSRRPLGP